EMGDSRIVVAGAKGFEGAGERFIGRIGGLRPCQGAGGDKNNGTHIALGIWCAVEAGILWESSLMGERLLLLVRKSGVRFLAGEGSPGQSGFLCLNASGPLTSPGLSQTWRRVSVSLTTSRTSKAGATIPVRA